MRFHLIDRIEAVELGKSLCAIKNLTLAEDYLADHFPSFPVMPGVLQLQALVEAGSWLLRVSEQFARSIWVLREVRGVKYGTFVAPGRALRMNVELMKQDGATATLKGRGEVENQQSIVATLILEGFCLRDCNPDWSDRDERLVRELKSHFEWLTGNCGRRPIAD
jgi:3-hydroxyacyl-[acyl-carrier-protein] dehydratase